MSSSSQTTFICDKCMNTVTQEKRPANWRQIKLVFDNDAFSETFDVCNECSDGPDMDTKNMNRKGLFDWLLGKKDSIALKADRDRFQTALVDIFDEAKACEKSLDIRGFHRIYQASEKALVGDPIVL